jgi:hypothetical protein
MLRSGLFELKKEYDQQILFLLLVCAYKFMNPTKVNEKCLSFTSQTIECIGLYDIMEINVNMAF